MVRCCRVLLLLLSLLSAAHADTPEADTPEADTSEVRATRPRLVVVLAIDQFRADWLRRLHDEFVPARLADGKPGGFRFLLENGADFRDARYEHVPLYTGPGHASLLSGAPPAHTGIVSNYWWDNEEKALRYCVDDAGCRVVGVASGSKAQPMGPRRLMVSTLGDELEFATAGRSHTVSLAVKDRAAILMAGHAADVCSWFDTSGGGWISSTAYFPSGLLPDWLQKVNARNLPAAALGTEWTPLLPPEREKLYASTAVDLLQSLGSGKGPLGLTFPHKIGGFDAFRRSPFANDYLFRTAEEAIVGEDMGRDDVPDLLTLSLSSQDLCGHDFGPFSREMVDMTLRTDRQLAQFLGWLDEHVSLSRVTFVMTADHGVTDIPEGRVNGKGMSQPPRFLETGFAAPLQKALAARFGPDSWVAGNGDGAFVENFTYLNPAAVARAVASGKARNEGEVQQIAAEAMRALHLPALYDVYTRWDILHGAVPANGVGRALTAGCHPRRSGDLVFLTDPHGLSVDYVASHGMPFAHDEHVPLLLSGCGIRPGRWAQRVSPLDLAPTLSQLLNVEYPSGCDGRPLAPALLLTNP